MSQRATRAPRSRRPAAVGRGTARGRGTAGGRAPADARGQADGNARGAGPGAGRSAGPAGAARRYRAQSSRITALAIRLPARRELDADLRRYFAVCEEKLGFVPNVLAAYSFDAVKLRAFIAMYNDLMLGDSGLARLEREMIAVVVSAANRCYYCLTAHGQAVRQLSGDPSLGEVLVMNHRTARITRRQRAMLEFVHKLSTEPAGVVEADRKALRRAGFTDRDVWDIAATAAFFNMTNRLATAVGMMPNPEYLALSR